jgi:hypothetical protein
MKNHLLTLLAWAAAAVSASAQLGVTATATHSFARNWQVVTENYITHRRFDLFNYGTSCVVDYRFKLRNNRFQVQPAVRFFRSNSDYALNAFQVSGIGIQSSIGVGLRRPSAKRRLWPYAQVTPALTLLALRHDFSDVPKGPVMRHLKHTLVPNIGLHLLAEYRLTDLLTVSPSVGGRCFPNALWDGFTEQISKSEGFDNYDLAQLWQYEFGLRIGLEFAKKKRR